MLNAIDWNVFQDLRRLLVIGSKFNNSSACFLRSMLQEPVDMPFIVHDHLAIDNARRVVHLGRPDPLVEEQSRNLLYG